MKALILAAGLGTRLAPLTNEIPKSLVKVNGKPILFKQIENLLENNVTDITIISGYKGDCLFKSVKEKWPNINIIENKDYQNTNNMYSAYMGIKNIGICDMIMMNADVFFDSSVISTLLKFSCNNAIVTDIGNYNIESMKVTTKEDRIISISKEITKEDALGSSIDVYKFSSTATKAFFEKCEEYIFKNKELKKWSEVALNDILKDISFKACPLVGRWYEIDNLEDLHAAELLFKD